MTETRTISNADVANAVLRRVKAAHPFIEGSLESIAREFGTTLVEPLPPAPAGTFRVNANVHVQQPGAGVVVFGPDEDLPRWAVQVLAAGNPSLLVEQQDEKP